MYLSVNVYKIIAIIVLIPRDDDAYIIADARKTEIKWAVSLAKREGGGRGRWKTRVLRGRMKY